VFITGAHPLRLVLPLSLEAAPPCHRQHRRKPACRASNVVTRAWKYPSAIELSVSFGGASAGAGRCAASKAVPQARAVYSVTAASNMSRSTSNMLSAAQQLLSALQRAERQRSTWWLLGHKWQIATHGWQVAHAMPLCLQQHAPLIEMSCYCSTWRYSTRMCLLSCSVPSHSAPGAPRGQSSSRAPRCCACNVRL
jgi:hypothetical protein